MYRLGFIFEACLANGLGLLAGTLNPEVVAVDLLWSQFAWPLGLALIGALAVGIVLGVVLCWLFSVLPLRIRLRRVRREAAGAARVPTGQND